MTMLSIRRGATALRRTGLVASQQVRTSSLSLKELQETLKQLNPKGKDSKGLNQLQEALEQLQKEAAEKKNDDAKKGSFYYIVHTTGPERLGMINEVSSAVSGAHMEILSSRATLLGGDFSMMVHLRSNDAAAIDALHSELAKVPGIDWWVHDASATNDSSHTVGPGRAARILRLSGDNCPGIIAAVSKYLHKRGVVVMNLASEMARGMLGGPPTFKLRLVLDVPGHLAREEVVTGVNALGRVLGAKMQVDSYLHCDEQE